MSRSPLFSIITVTFNAGNELQKTIDSVTCQDFKNFEYIIIDGASKDNTLEIIKNNSSSIFKWISEPDGGIYEAMNKGIKMAAGDWINFMNAGDVFTGPRVLDAVCKKLDPIADVVYGDRNYIDQDGLVVKQAARSIETIFERMPFGHQSMFVKNDVLQNMLFNETYKYAADYELLIRLFIDGAKFQYIEETICNFASGGASESGLRPHLEVVKILLDNVKEKEVIRNNKYLISFQKEFKSLMKKTLR